MLEKISASILCCCFIVMNLDAGQLFSLIDHDKKLQIDYQGRELVSGEAASYPTSDILQSARTGQNTFKDAHGWTVSNIWGQKGQVKFRREAGVSPDGKEVEINFQGYVPAYADKINTNAEYAIYLDLKTLEGMEWKAVTGRTWVNKSENGRIEPDMADKSLTVLPVRMISFTGRGTSFTLDFNPEGPGTYSDFGPTHVQGLWSVRKEGTRLKCSFSAAVRIHGAVYNSKMVIYDGTIEDRAVRHAFETFEYYFELPATRQFCFGAVKSGKGYLNAGTGPFAEKQGYGWLDAKNLVVNKYYPSGALYSSVSGEGKTTFKTQLVKGLYLVTLRCAAYEKESGVFSFVLNNEPKAESVKIPPGVIRTFTWAQWLENGYAELQLDGKWQLSALTFQRLMSSCEDYKIRRGFWRVTGFEPSQLYRSAYYDKLAVMPVGIDDMPLSEPAKDYSQVKVDLKKEVLLPKYGAALPDWRYTAVIGTPGAGNNGSFEDFDDIVKINRRLDEMSKDGINVIIINGLLSRHTFPEHLDRVRRNIALLTAESHKRGMKVIDHIDLTLLWDWGTGFRELTKTPELLMRTVNGSLPTTGMCPVNPDYKKKFYAEHIAFIKATGIDGMMVDEVNFYSDNFCGCSHCREQFTKDTGMVLPVDETSPELFNKDSRLWRTWLAWRMKAIGDWWVNFRREINKVKPDFVLTTYC